MRGMKSVLVCFIMAVSVLGFSQKIDYQNFDESLATEALKKAFSNFRDTFSHFSTDPKFKLSEYCIDLANDSNLRKMRWSDYLYKNISTKNCERILLTNVFEHTDVINWVKTNRDLLLKEYLQGSYLPSVEKQSARISYNENLFRVSNPDYETYDDLAKEIINLWCKSKLHAATLRSVGYSYGMYDRHGYKKTSLFSVCVIIDETTKTIVASLNLINFS